MLRNSRLPSPKYAPFQWSDLSDDSQSLSSLRRNMVAGPKVRESTVTRGRLEACYHYTIATQLPSSQPRSSGWYLEVRTGNTWLNDSKSTARLTCTAHRAFIGTLDLRILLVSPTSPFRSCLPFFFRDMLRMRSQNLTRIRY